jgi:hypothetical protein
VLPLFVGVLSQTINPGQWMQNNLKK